MPQKADQVRGRAARRVAGVFAALGHADQVPQLASLPLELDFQHLPFWLIGPPSMRSAEAGAAATRAAMATVAAARVIWRMNAFPWVSCFTFTWSVQL
jgi:hypothetical protein